MAGHDDLPLADDDHLPLGALRYRVRALTEERLRKPLEYERSHADRLPAVEVVTAACAGWRAAPPPRPVSRAPSCSPSGPIRRAGDRR
ncbi:hypothetical protein [Streptomyces antimycoticus]|uniref:hypothetical protein n=1 Tax=Streptomyces antimycoticus TaxID=68175 RepID=UPI0037F4E084